MLKNTRKGITLVSLVITIIVLLILAAVAISIAVDANGLFARAGKAGQDWNRSVENESATIKELNDNLLELTFDRTGVNIGDIVNYEPNTATMNYLLTEDKSGYTSEQKINREKYTYKVLNVNPDGSVDIMGVPTSSMGIVHLRGAAGYNNGVYLLDEMCNALYSNTVLGATARSIDLDDIERQMNNIGLEARKEYNNNVALLGETKPYSEGGVYPKLALYENHIGINSEELNTKGIGESSTGTEQKEITIPLLESDTEKHENSKTNADTMTVQQTFYSVEQESKYYYNAEFYDLVFNTNTMYWLATRFTSPGGTGAYFGIRHINQKTISGINLFRHDDTLLENSVRLAPVISLGTNIKMIKQDDGSWNLEK